MSIDYILNDSADPSKRLRAGFESPGALDVAYEGHLPFAHGPMGMGLLNSGFDILPVAKSAADLVLSGIGHSSGESLVSHESPHYGPPSSFTPDLSSLPDDVSESSTPRLSTASSLAEDEPELTSPATSPWLTGELLSGQYLHRLSRSPYVPNKFWCVGASSTAGPSVVEKPSDTCYGSVGETAGHVGYNLADPSPAKLGCNPQMIPVQLSSSHTERPQGFRTNRLTTRYEDGEVLRYGAGESYRPFNNGNRDRERSPPPRRIRSPLRARSPIRDRDRDLRARTPPIVSDSYVPNRSPRRRSRSPDRYRGPDRARDMGGESWRRRDNSRPRMRSPVRRMSPRRSPRRSPGRFSPGPRRDDRFDRVRSPRRDFDIRDR